MRITHPDFIKIFYFLRLTMYAAAPRTPSPLEIPINGIIAVEALAPGLYWFFLFISLFSFVVMNHVTVI